MPSSWMVNAQSESTTILAFAIRGLRCKRAGARLGVRRGYLDRYDGQSKKIHVGTNGVGEAEVACWPMESRGIACACPRSYTNRRSKKWQLPRAFRRNRQHLDYTYLRY
jgi:hypothetical protein